MQTTLNQIREHSPCHEGWTKLLRSLNKTKADDEPFSIVQVLDSNGLDDALWCLRAVKGCDKEIRLFAVWCARQVEHLMPDERSTQALVVAERHANGEATDTELSTAGAAAGAAARDAAYAAADAAADAAAAAAAAAYAAAGADAAAAADAAASAAAYAAAGADAAAYAAADAAAYAAASAYAAARDAQEKELRRVRCRIRS